MKRDKFTQKSQEAVGSFLTVIFVLLITACAPRAQPAGTAWGDGSIFFKWRTHLFHIYK